MTWLAGLERCWDMQEGMKIPGKWEIHRNSCNSHWCFWVCHRLSGFAPEFGHFLFGMQSHLRGLVFDMSSLNHKSLWSGLDASKGLAKTRPFSHKFPQCLRWLNKKSSRNRKMVHGPIVGFLRVNTGSVERPETRDLWEQESCGTYPVPLGTGVAGQCCIVLSHGQFPSWHPQHVTNTNKWKLSQSGWSTIAFSRVCTIWTLADFKSSQVFKQFHYIALLVLVIFWGLLPPGFCWYIACHPCWAFHLHRSLEGARCCPAKWPEQLVLGCFLLAPGTQREWVVVNCFLHVFFL